MTCSAPIPRGADDGGRSGHDPSGYPGYGSSTPVANAIAAGVDPVHNGLGGVPGGASHSETRG